MFEHAVLSSVSSAQVLSAQVSRVLHEPQPFSTSLQSVIRLGRRQRAESGRTTAMLMKGKSTERIPDGIRVTGGVVMASRSVVDEEKIVGRSGGGR